MISTFLCSCGSKELKKEEANAIISQHWQLPFQVKIALDQKYDNYGWPPEKYRRLANQGIITLTKTGGSIFYDKYEASVTENGRKYWINDGYMKVNGETILQIIFEGYKVAIKELSISSNAKENKAEAEILLVYSDISPIQEIFSPLKETQVKRTLYFKLFDDGWKIVEDENSKKFINPIMNPLHWIDNGQIIFNETQEDKSISTNSEKSKENSQEGDSFIGKWSEDGTTNTEVFTISKSGSGYYIESNVLFDGAKTEWKAKLANGVLVGRPPDDMTGKNTTVKVDGAKLEIINLFGNNKSLKKVR